jgi:hypothetical protein
MKQLARKAVLVVVLLLASVGTASAECAWVLWFLYAGGDSGPNFGPNRSLLVHATRQECEQQKKDMAKDWDTKKEAEQYSGPLSPLRRTHPSHWVCLPDTIDPRAAKAK